VGTSKSQPSPIGRSESGKAWKEVVENLSEGVTATATFASILSAYKKEYKEQTLNVLADKGVIAIEKLVSEYRPPSGTTESSEIVADYFIRARTILAEKQSNSFLAELALSAGTIAVTSTEDRGTSFCTSYFSKLLEYIISRDLPRVFGSAGLPNNYSVEQFIKSSSKDLKSVAKSGDLSKALSALLKKVED